jgi:uncharacterized repeat protein (TIGR03803 family)
MKFAFAFIAGAAILPAYAGAASVTTVYSFTGEADGRSPEGGLVAVGNLLYGTTYTGGKKSLGVVYALDPATGKETVLHSFTGASDGANPAAALLPLGGFLYGTTEAGGTKSFGTVFKIDPTSGALTTLYSFTGGVDGGQPTAGLIAYGGYLYGTTLWRGANGYGTVFRIDPATGNETVLHAFTGKPDGGNPAAGLVAVSTELYGTASSGGYPFDYGGPGLLYKIETTTSNELKLQLFDGTNGSAPYAGLTPVGKVLYGTTVEGGSAQYGTVFSYNLETRAFNVLYSFTDGADGALPMAGLLSYGGALYGVASKGGADMVGEAFRINPKTGALTKLHTFTGVKGDGAFPTTTLISVGAVMYGTTTGGGKYDAGAVFKLTP